MRVYLQFLVEELDFSTFPNGWPEESFHCLSVIFAAPVVCAAKSDKDEFPEIPASSVSVIARGYLYNTFQ